MNIVSLSNKTIPTFSCSVWSFNKQEVQEHKNLVVRVIIITNFSNEVKPVTMLALLFIVTGLLNVQL